MMSATNLNTARPEWMSAQVTVDSRSDFKIVMEGRATNGGYAVDQLVFSPGKCSSKIRIGYTNLKSHVEIEVSKDFFHQ